MKDGTTISSLRVIDNKHVLCTYLNVRDHTNHLTCITSLNFPNSVRQIAITPIS